MATVGKSADPVMPAGPALEVHSAMSSCSKAIVITSGFVGACLPSVLVGQQNVYISLFDGNAGLVGLFTFLAILYTVWATPMLGRLADEGRFNILCFSDRQSWGRRAPLAFIMIPIGSIGFFLNFVGPAKLGENGVGLWFGMVTFLCSTAVAGFNVASTSAISELFPTDAERVSLIMRRGAAQALGGFIGAAGVASLALSQDAKGSTEQIGLFLVLGVFCILLWLLVIPWALVMRQSVAKKETEQVWLCQACKDAFAVVPMFRTLCIAEHIVAAGATTLLISYPFFLQDVLMFETNEVSAAFAFFLGSITLCAVGGAPLIGCLSKRFLPAKVLSLTVFAASVLVPIGFIIGYAVKDDFASSVGVMTAFGGPVCGLASAAGLMVRVVLVTKMVDMDQVTRAKQAGCMQADGTVSDPSAIPPRRDGLFQATFGACAFLGSAWAGLFPILINVLGYESKRRDTIPPQEQEGRVRYATFIVIAALCPALQLVYSMIMWNFPLHGETLDQLSQDYSALFVSMKTEDSSKVVKKPEAVAPPPAEHVGS